MEGSTKKTESEVQDLDLCWFSQGPSTLETIFQSRLAELEDLEDSNPASRAELLTQIARAEAIQGKISEAKVTLEVASKTLSEMVLIAPVTTRIRLLLEEGRLLILQKTPSQARTRFATAWTLAVNAREDFFVIDIARMMAEIEPMKLQEEWIRKAIETAEGTHQEKARFWLGHLYADLGWRLFDLRQFEASLKAHECSRENYQNLSLKADALRAKWSVARLLRQLGRVLEALELNEALLLEVSSGAPLYGRLCEETAECLWALDQRELARRHFANAYEELSRSTWIADRHPLRMKRLKDLGKVT